MSVARDSVAGESASRNRAAFSGRRGFTLIELLVAIAIIAIIATIALGALFRAQEVAKDAKAKATVTKLHSQIMDRWETYTTRRLPISIQFGERLYDPGNNDSVSGLGFAWRQLSARRELMLMELPERWTDVIDNPSPLTPRAPLLLPTRTALSQGYFRYLQQKYIASTNQLYTFQSAECLYMILMMGQDITAVEQLAHAEVGDKDADGLKEFHDAFGNPIFFWRWAPGFAVMNGVDSALQEGWLVQDYINNPNARYDHDPFDTRRVHVPGQNVPTIAYTLYPLIVSMGPDGVSDLKFNNSPAPPEFRYMLDANGHLDPYLDPGGGILMGGPIDTAGDGPNHLDNIHSHLKGQR